jgi:hypothetical protein
VNISSADPVSNVPTNAGIEQIAFIDLSTRNGMPERQGLLGRQRNVLLQKPRNCWLIRKHTTLCQKPKTLTETGRRHNALLTI